MDLLDRKKNNFNSEECKNFVSKYIFNQIPIRDRNKLFYKNSILVNWENDNEDCEWTQDFLDNPDTFFLYDIREDGNYNIYGACLLKFIPHNDRLICYVQIRCTYNNTGNTILSSGRLLWSYILNYCYICKMYYNLPNKFIILNHAISSAVGYHLLMGMRPYKNSEIYKNRILSEEELISILKEMFTQNSNNTELALNDYLYGNHLNNSKKLLNSPHTSYLFYTEKDNINYNDICDIIEKNQKIRKANFPNFKHTRTHGGKKKKINKKNKRSKHI